MTSDGYDELPYASMPYPQTQPSRLAAVAALHGLSAPPVENARVLELGCASGGNLIPLAARFPGARFLGVDLGRRHVDEANRTIEALSLTNIEIHLADIAKFVAEREFDYVICHGVFSWTPPEVQEAIFRICAASMSENAVALVSFNVLPGWHLRNAIRDLCLRHVDQSLTALQRIARVRVLLNDIAAASVGDDTYGMLMKREAMRLAHRPASYIAGEFLAAHNAPCHFREFVARARGYGLDYVAEADIDASTPGVARGQLGKSIEVYAAGDRFEREQRIDDFTGRTFRHAVLVRHGAARVAPAPGGLKNLYISTRLRIAQNQAQEKAVTFKDSNNRCMHVSNEEVVRLLRVISGASPQTLSIQDLATLLETAEDTLCETLFLPVRLGYVDVSSAPLRAGASTRRRPAVWEVARRQAEAGQPWLTNHRHEPVASTPAIALVGRLLDGAREIREVQGAVSAAIRNGSMSTQQNPTGPSTEEGAERFVERAIEYLSREALLT